MDNPSINIKSKICQKHNQPILYYDQNGRNPQCQVCMLEKGKLITFDQIQKQYQEKVIINNKEYDLQLQQLNTLKEGILKYKENIIACLDKSIQQITDQINCIQSQKQSMQQLDMIVNQYESVEDLTTYLNNNQKSNRQFRKQIVINLLLGLKQKIRNIDFLDIILNSRKQLIQQTNVTHKVLKQEVVLEKQKRPQKMEYELIQQVESKLQIYDFVVDQRTNTLIAGLKEGIIKIFDFQNGKLGAEIQSLQKHTDSVVSLYCLKNTFNFISGSYDSSIIIWCFHKANKWKIQQTLKSHTRKIRCLIMNSREDLLISGGDDFTVKFWKKLSEKWDLSQTVNACEDVNALSLNENEDKLIVSIKNQIVVMGIDKNQKWKFIQTIKVKAYGCRLCFTIQDQFVFQPVMSDLEVYDYDGYQQQFQEKSKVKVQIVATDDHLFHCQFIKNLNILTVKHGDFVNIFKANQNGEYKLIQSIEYQTCYQYGRMTDDGEYLITWDRGSEEIQVRKLKFKRESS